jgi:hypothetical protein
MKTTPTRKMPSPAVAAASLPLGVSPETADLLARLNARWEKFNKLSKSKQRAELIARGVLTAEGKLPTYPMDHVPLGPMY